MRIKIQQINIDIFSNQTLLEPIDCLFSLCKWKNDSKRFKTERYFSLKRIIDNYNVIIKAKNFYGQAIDSDIKQYEEVRKLTTEQGKDYTTGCLLDYDYIKNHCKLIALDFEQTKRIRC